MAKSNGGGGRRNKSDENNPVAVAVDNPPQTEKDQVSPMVKKVTTQNMTVTPPGGRTVQTTVEITEYLTLPAARKELGDSVALKLINDGLNLQARTKRRNEIVSGGNEKKVDNLLKRLQKVDPRVAEAAAAAWQTITETPANVAPTGQQ